MNLRILAGAALLAGTFGLTACNNQTEQVVEATDGVDGLMIENARLILPAVAANPGVVYFDITYDGETPQTLAAVSVDGAMSAMMHDYAEKDNTVEMLPLEPVELTKGTKVSFEPGGKHVMAMKVSPELAAGGKTEVTLSLATGDKKSFTAEILGAGDAR